jgi:internalin A
MTKLKELALDSNKIVSVERIENLTSLTLLSLDSNLIESLQGLENLKQLSSLKLAFNRIVSIQRIENLTQMKFLYLQSNQIETVQFLSKMASLWTLNLNSNKIRFLNGTEKLKSLIYLYLDSNKIESFPNMDNLTSLRELYLKSNKILKLNGIEKIKSLWILDLRSNKITTVQGLVNFKNLIFLDLNYNFIQSSRGLLNVIYLQTLDLKYNNISSLTTSSFNQTHFPLIKQIFLTGNQIRVIANSAFSGLPDLSIIYIDNNLIEIIESFAFNRILNIGFISLKNNQIKTVFDCAFYRLKQIAPMSSVDFFENFNLSKIFNQSFAKLNGMRLSYNSPILSNTDEYVSSYFDFNILDLSKNNISRLWKNSIRGKFYALNLKSNILTEFESNSFDDVSNLREISFSKNLIRNLDFDYAFRFTLTNLTKLDFTFNKIISISGDFFRKFPNLLQLDLANNDFFRIGKEFFLNLYNLKFLYISNNQILDIEVGSFNSLKSLTRLDLRNNLIYNLRGNLFENLTMLCELLISKNKITAVFGEQFNNMFNLNFLDLRENEIKLLSENAFENFSNLDTLYLGSNRMSHLSTKFKVKNLELSDNMFHFLNLSSLNSNSYYLDLSNNILNETKSLNFYDFKRLKILNLSRIHSDNLILNLAFPSNSTLEELNLNFNNLSLMRKDFFENLTNLKRLYLKETNLIYFDFLINMITLTSFDFSDNLEYFKTPAMPKVLSSVKYAQISNTSFLSRLTFPWDLFETLNASHNKLEFLSDSEDQGKNIVYLDLSHNQFIFIFTNEIEIKVFAKTFIYLRFLNLAKSMTRSMSNKIFYFNKILEEVHLNDNFLTSFPIFCQFCGINSPSCLAQLTMVNFQCKLRVLNFDSNFLKSLYYRDLNELENLEILNLDNNQLDFIEEKSFSKLNKLETLILSRNNLSDDSFPILIFNPLVNLKLLNLSSNLMEFVSSYFFNQLQKLETLDLSFNRLQLVESYSFYKLINLENLHLNDNANDIQIHNESFIQLDLIQNIHLSKSILNEQTIEIFLDLFKYKNSLETKIVLKRHLYKSLFLLSKYTQYGCDLTLFFIRNNVHYNFKSETEIFDYFNECSQMRIKDVSQNLNHSSFINRNERIFSNIIFYFFFFTIMFIFFLGIICFFSGARGKKNR